MLCQTASHTLPSHGQDCLCCSHTIVGDENLASKQPPQGNDSRLTAIGPYDKTMLYLLQVVLSPVIEAFEWTNMLRRLARAMGLSTFFNYMSDSNRHWTHIFSCWNSHDSGIFVKVFLQQTRNHSNSLPNQFNVHAFRMTRFPCRSLT